MTLVSILIASLGRPSLLQTLASIQAARRPEGVDVEIVIADDSGTAAVAAALDGFAATLPIRIVPTGARNVSIARNTTIDAARGDWLLMVDDDEFVDAGWLEGHLSTAAECKADVVFGPVHPVYPADTPDWLKAVDPMFHDMGWSNHGRRVSYGQSGNTLMRAEIVRRYDMRFDPDFGKTGGEDSDFFRRFAARGATMVVTDRAKAWETVPADRIVPHYLLRRRIRTGRIYARTALRDATARRRIAFAVDSLIKLVLAGGAALVFRATDRSRSFRMQMKFFSNLGKLTGVAGARPGLAWS